MGQKQLPHRNNEQEERSENTSLTGFVYRCMEFTYREYMDILSKLVDKGFVFSQYDNYDDHEKSVILRHDVDVSVSDAEKIAKMETAFDKTCHSTFFFLISSDFYNVFSKESARAINNIHELGHSIGLHFDETKYFSQDNWNQEELIAWILKEKSLLEEMTGLRVETVSMHRPTPKTIESNIEIPGLLNTYSEVFFKKLKYASDSYHRWREDIYSIIASDEVNRLHLLTHPFWYHDDSYSRKQTFEEFISEGYEYRRDLIEKNVLPPNTTFEESIREEE